MPFSSVMKDKISIFDEQGSLVARDQAASIQGGKRIFTKTADFVVDIDYLIERRLPNGLVEKYRVIEPNFMAGVHGISDHYQMTVTNVKRPLAKTKSAESVVNNITLSGQASYYNNSSNNSINTYNIYTLHQYEKALEAVNNEIIGLDLEQSERNLIKSSLAAIKSELMKPAPNEGVLSACISLLPTSIATLESVLNLGQMLGLS